MIPRTTPDPADAAAMVRLVTPFGTFTVSDDEIVTFPSGLPGFERCRRFVVLSSPELAPMRCLQTVDDQAASFLVIDPRAALPDYRCILGATDLMRLGATAETPLVWLAIVSFDADGAAFVNLRAPVVINPERMLGFQVMPHNSLYPLRHPLASL
jgi:flagellar assembly factor FliW